MLHHINLCIFFITHILVCNYFIHVPIDLPPSLSTHAGKHQPHMAI